MIAPLSPEDAARLAKLEDWYNTRTFGPPEGSERFLLRIYRQQQAALAAARAAIKRLRAPAVSLFTDGEFVAHSGVTLPFKIDCDALTDADIATLAKEISRRTKFSVVVGIPRGGLRLAAALEQYCQPSAPVLIADDVLTTGRSMEAERHLHPG